MPHVLRPERPVERPAGNPAHARARAVPQLLDRRLPQLVPVPGILPCRQHQRHPLRAISSACAPYTVFATSVVRNRNYRVQYSIAS